MMVITGSATHYLSLTLVSSQLNQQVTVWDLGELSNDTLLHVILPLIQYSCEMSDWLPGDVHVMQGH